MFVVEKLWKLPSCWSPGGCLELGRDVHYLAHALGKERSGQGSSRMSKICWAGMSGAIYSKDVSRCALWISGQSGVSVHWSPIVVPTLHVSTRPKIEK